MRTIVLDTNCLLAVLPSISPYHQVWTDLLEGNICLCVSNEILEEYEEVLTQKINVEISKAVIKLILSLPNLKRVRPTYFLHLIEVDPDDNKFVDCAFCGEAELIVTNDTHFNVLREIQFPKIFIMKLQEFLKILQ